MRPLEIPGLYWTYIKPGWPDVTGTATHQKHLNSLILSHTLITSRRVDTSYLDRNCIYGRLPWTSDSVTSKTSNTPDPTRVNYFDSTSPGFGSFGYISSSPSSPGMGNVCTFSEVTKSHTPQARSQNVSKNKNLDNSSKAKVYEVQMTGEEWMETFMSAGRYNYGLTEEEDDFSHADPKGSEFKYSSSLSHPLETSETSEMLNSDFTQPDDATNTLEDVPEISRDVWDSFPRNSHEIRMENDYIRDGKNSHIWEAFLQDGTESNVESSSLEDGLEWDFLHTGIDGSNHKRLPETMNCINQGLLLSTNDVPEYKHQRNMARNVPWENGEKPGKDFDFDWAWREQNHHGDNDDQKVFPTYKGMKLEGPLEDFRYQQDKVDNKRKMEYTALKNECGNAKDGHSKLGRQLQAWLNQGIGFDDQQPAGYDKQGERCDKQDNGCDTQEWDNPQESDKQNKRCHKQTDQCHPHGDSGKSVNKYLCNSKNKQSRNTDCMGVTDKENADRKSGFNVDSSLPPNQELTAIDSSTELLPILKSQLQLMSCDTLSDSLSNISISSFDSSISSSSLSSEYSKDPVPLVHELNPIEHKLYGSRTRIPRSYRQQNIFNHDFLSEVNNTRSTTALPSTAFSRGEELPVPRPIRRARSCSFDLLGQKNLDKDNCQLGATRYVPRYHLSDYDGLGNRPSYGPNDRQSSDYFLCETRRQTMITTRTSYELNFANWSSVASTGKKWYTSTPNWYNDTVSVPRIETRAFSSCNYVSRSNSLSLNFEKSSPFMTSQRAINNIPYTGLQSCPNFQSVKNLNSPNIP